MWKNLPSEVRKDWKEKAQSSREALDTGLAEPKTCPTCNITFSREKYHKKGCHECVCDVCEEMFNHENKLKRHKDKTHRNSYKCDHCQKTFSEKRNLTRHTNCQHK